MINVLLMHRVEKEPSEWMCISVDLFRVLLKKIMESGVESFTIGANKTKMVDSICLTFDDGWASDYEIVFPMLLEHKLKATFFITSDWVGKPGHVTWSQLRDMRKAGMEIGSHTMTHPYLRTLKEKQQYNELRRSKLDIEDGIGEEIKIFSFPYGDFNSRLIVLAKKAGYEFVATSKPGFSYPTATVIRRNALHAGYKLKDIDRIIKPSYFQILANQGNYFLRGFVKDIFGVERYLKLKKAVLRIKNQC